MPTPAEKRHNFFGVFLQFHIGVDNLRHLFARTFYRVCRDVVQLADVLGHSSVETTRIYLASTGDEYVRRINRLGLIS